MVERSPRSDVMRLRSSRRLRSTSFGLGSLGAFASVIACGGGGNGGGAAFFGAANGPTHMSILPRQMGPSRGLHDRDSWIDS